MLKPLKPKPYPPAWLCFPLSKTLGLPYHGRLSKQMTVACTEMAWQPIGWCGPMLVMTPILVSHWATKCIGWKDTTIRTTLALSHWWGLVHSMNWNILQKKVGICSGKLLPAHKKTPWHYFFKAFSHKLELPGLTLLKQSITPTILLICLDFSWQPEIRKKDLLPLTLCPENWQ